MRTIRNHPSAPRRHLAIWCVDESGSVFAFEGTPGVCAAVLARALTGVPDLS